eukprot:SAG11_NODE_927_length_6519_cov_2.357788_3_plen_120_part_00
MVSPPVVGFVGMGSPCSTDGIDPDSCKNVLIENYYYNGGDDAIGAPAGAAQLSLPFDAYSCSKTTCHWCRCRRLDRKHAFICGGAAVKSGWNYAGYHMNMSSENILARNCSSNGRGGYT